MRSEDTQMKKNRLLKTFVISIVLILTSLSAISGQSSLAVQSRIIGDVNKDGSMSIVDALLIAQFYVGFTSVDAYLPFGDPSNDDTIDIVDALLIAKFYVGLIAEFPRKSPIDTVKAWADANKVNLTGYIISLYGTKETAAILPGYSFVVLIVRQYPVAYGPTDPLLGTNAIAAVDKNSTVEIINTTDKLIQFFRAHEIPAKDEATLIATGKSWLAMSQELKDDGFYTFTIRDGGVVILPVDSIQVEGICEVTGGGSGAIKANIWFETPSYLIYNVVEQVSLVPGVRPICQSTKLLDNDPVVRKMAEQDLLVMGRSCFDYLKVQRAKASPDLKKAIDRIKERILEQEIKLAEIRALLQR
jgi:hypothetical protein